MKEPEFLSDEEAAGLLQNAIESAGASGLSEDDALKVFQWANGVRAEAAMLDLVIRSEVDVVVEDGELVFVHPEHSARIR